MNIDEAIETTKRIRAQLTKAIVGQERVLDELMIGLLTGGHLLLEGPPGTAKTLMARVLAMTIRGQFGRVQFTPDLMPVDLVGVNVYDESDRRFKFHPGPIFCDILLADEINRAPAKTQSALLQAMQEQAVTVDGETHPLSPIFTVVATQNPVEYEGTYPLPEAQLDRFMLKIVIGYPSAEAEQSMLALHRDSFDPTHLESAHIEPTASVESLAGARAAIRTVKLTDDLLRYITAIVRASREFHGLTLGASPRAAVMLMAASRATAALRGRDYVTPDDVRDAAAPTLRHRLLLTPESEIEGVTTARCVEQILQRVEVPRISPTQ